MIVDQVEEFGGSLIQHGPANNRAYLMKLNRRDFPQILSYLNSLAMLKKYSKIFAKIPAYARDKFEQAGYQVEAKIPQFYAGEEDGFFMARYYHADRRIDHAAVKVQEVLEVACNKAVSIEPTLPNDDYEYRLAQPADCAQMARLYQQVFASYPFPIGDKDYLAETMAKNLLYAGVWKKGVLLALASAEIDYPGSNAELTDFATDPDWQGHGFANLLLHQLETEMRASGIKTCFTIARATSFGMNVCFSKNGYQFSGTLVKNTQISGGLESMNVWYKHI